jgi:hypothetical protein
MRRKLPVIVCTLLGAAAGCQHSHPAWNRGSMSTPMAAASPSAAANTAMGATAPGKATTSGGSSDLTSRSSISIPGNAPRQSSTSAVTPASGGIPASLGPMGSLSNPPASSNNNTPAAFGNPMPPLSTSPSPSAPPAPAPVPGSALSGSGN